VILRSAVRLGLAAFAVFVLLPIAILGLATLTGLRAGMVTPEFFLLMGGAGALACAAVAFATGSPVLAKRLMLGATLATVVIVAKFALPGVFQRIAGAAHRTSERALASELIAATPAVVPCTEPFYIGPAGVNRYWFSLDDAQPLCYDRAGRDPRTGRALDPMDRVVADYVRLRATHAELEAKLAQAVRQTTERIAEVPALLPEPASVAVAVLPEPNPVPAPLQPEWTTPTIPDTLLKEPPR
jgi:hypothetical protein